MRERVIAWRPAGLIAAQLDVVGGDLDVLLPQVFGENTPHLAITDKAYVPMPGIGRSHRHFRTISRFGPGNAVTALEFRPARSRHSICRCRPYAGPSSPPPSSLLPP